MNYTILPICGFTPQIGENCFIADGVRLIGEVIIGNNSSIWFNSVLRGDVGRIEIGENSNIQDGCSLHTMYKTSSIKIGNFVSIGHNATLHGPIIHDFALIGMGATLLDNVEVGEGAIVAAGSVVLSGTKIEPYTLYGGYPAKFIKKLDRKQKNSMNFQNAKHYVEYAEWYLNPSKIHTRDVKNK